jgi:hypothetical protein
MKDYSCGGDWAYLYVRVHYYLWSRFKMYEFSMILSFAQDVLYIFFCGPKPSAL